jgi:hypothetical protein
MKHIRPFVGAAFLALSLATLSAPVAALADEVEIILPGGVTFAPPSDSDDDFSPNTGLTLPSIDTDRNSDLASAFSAAAPSSSSSSSSSSDADSRPTLQTRHFGARIDVTCKVSSTSTGLVLVNNSPDPLPPGTRIKWQLKKDGQRGYFAIMGELGGGKSLVADNVLGNKVKNGETCIARVI